MRPGMKKILKLACGRGFPTATLACHNRDMTTTQTRISHLTTSELISYFEELNARRYNGGRKDGGYDRRRQVINRVVDEIADRADRGDAEADKWLA